MMIIALRSLAAAEALQVILTHEKIEYEVCAGPGVKVILTNALRGDLLATLGQWNMAVHVAREAVLEAK